jgi:hypothetical protein
VGAAALEGQPGVISVEKGWRRFKEINHVVYDPARISIAQMEQLLREAGTYRSTVIE